MTLYILCQHLNNYFDHERRFGTFEISGGTLEIEGAQNGQYVRIVGSVFNDGVYQYPLSNLTNETFDGAVWLLAIPKIIVDMVGEIDDWQNANADVLSSPYQSESFGGYSYTKASGGSIQNGGSGILTWQSFFKSRLDEWRKICPY